MSRGSSCNSFCHRFCAWSCSAVVVSGFVAGIGWSLVTIWPVALGLSLLFVVLLLATVQKFHKSVDDSTSSKGDALPAADTAAVGTGDQTTPHVEDPAADSDGPPRNGTPTPAVPLSLSMIYIVLVLSLAVPGAIVAFKLIPYSTDRHWNWNGPWDGPALWSVDNVSELSPKVRSWMETIHFDMLHTYGSSNKGHGTFCNISDTIYFSGKASGHNRGSSNALIVVTGEASATEFGNFRNPTWLTRVANTTCCFCEDGPMISCVDKHGGFGSEFGRSVSLDQDAIPESLTEIDGLLWLVTFSRGSRNPLDVLSLDPTTMDLVEYPVKMRPMDETEKHAQVLAGDDDPEYDDDDDYYNGRNHDDYLVYDGNHGMYDGSIDNVSIGQVLGTLFMSALPIVVVSIWLWKQKAIPSSSFTLFVGLGLVCHCVASAFEPEYFFDGDGIMIWLSIGTPVWILASAFVVAVNKRGNKSVLYFSLYSNSSFATVCLLSLVISYESLEWSDEEWRVDSSEEAEFLFVLTVLAFIPLTLVGIAVRSTYIYVLGVIGISTIVSIATLRLSRHLNIWVSASILAVSSLILILCGCVVHRKREMIHDRMTSCLAGCVGHNYDEANPAEVEITGLVPNEAATES